VTDVPAAGDLRHVVLVGHPGAGTTTLVDALVRRARGLAAAATRPVARAGWSVAGSLLPLGPPAPSPSPSPFPSHRPTTALAASRLDHRGTQVTLLDVPSDLELTGALAVGLRAADAALFVVSGIDGISPRLVQLWEQCESDEVPRALVITQLDQPRAEFDESVALCQRLLGEGVQPLQVPLHAEDDSIVGLIDLLGPHLHDWSSGEPAVRDPDLEHLQLVEGLHADLVEAVLAGSEDESLLDAYLDEEPLEPAVLAREFTSAVRRGALQPVLAVVPGSAVGTQELLDLLVSAFPAPSDVPPAVLTHPDGSPAEASRVDATGPLVVELLAAVDEGTGPPCVAAPPPSVAATPPSVATAPMIEGRPSSVATAPPIDGRPSSVATAPPNEGRPSSVATTAPSDAPYLVRIRSGILRPSDQALVTARPGAELVAAHAADLQLHDVVGRAVPVLVAGELGLVHGLVPGQAWRTLSLAEEPLVLAFPALPAPPHPTALESAAGPAALLRALMPVVRRDPTARLEESVAGQVLLWSLGERHARLLLAGLDVDVRVVPVTTPPVPGPDGSPHEPYSAIEVHVPPVYARTVVSLLASRRPRWTRTEAAPAEDLTVVLTELPDAETLDLSAALAAASYGTALLLRSPARPQPGTS